MTAQDYPVFFPYGATSAPYSASRPHRGNDRECPNGTPVTIGGTTIGLSGNSGSYQGQPYGPHLHTQAGRDEWVQSTIEPTPYEFKPGTVVKTGSASEWGKYVCVRVGDVNVFYCHLSRIDVSVGQVIEGGDMSATLQRGDVTAIWQCFMRTDPKEEDYQFAIGKTWDEYMKIIMGNPYATVQKSDVDNIWNKWMKTKPEKGDYDYGQGKNFGKYLYDVMNNPNSVSVGEGTPDEIVVDGVVYKKES